MVRIIQCRTVLHAKCKIKMTSTLCTIVLNGVVSIRRHYRHSTTHYIRITSKTVNYRYIISFERLA